MTIDEQGNPINQENTMDVIKLEDSEMIRGMFTKLANAFVEASDLAKRVSLLQTELQKITDALTVANEAAAKAIAERDVAVKERDRARELQEQAEYAFRNVNEQRINTARELADVKEQINAVKVDRDNVLRQLNDAKDEVTLWREENEKLVKSSEETIASANARTERVRAENETLISALRMEVQALKDERVKLQDELVVHERDTTMLRKIISEAKLAAQGTVGVLAGEMAAE
jgi:chromosome segregation ATPase